MSHLFKFLFSDHTGDEYIIAFPENRDIVPVVFITTMVNTTVTIESPHPNVSKTINVTAENGAVMDLPPSLMLVGNAIEEKGVLVKAPVDIAVYVFSYSMDRYGEAYTALPVNKLGTLYTSIDDNYVTIIAYQDDTHVNITVQDTVSYNGHTYHKGDQIDVYLARLNTFQIQVSCANVSSERPVAFISHKFIRGDYNGSANITSTMIEYIPPSKSFGEKFIVPFRLSNCDEYIRSDTYTYSQCSGSNCVYRTDKPGLVLSYIQCEQSINFVRQYANLVIPAISQYSNNYKYITPGMEYFKNYAVIMIEAKYVDGLRFDGKTLYAINPDVQAIIVENSMYIIASINVDEGQHMAYHVYSNITFGMIAYGQVDELRYEFPVGLKL